MDILIIFIIIATFFVVLSTIKKYTPSDRREGFHNNRVGNHNNHRRNKRITYTSYRVNNLPNSRADNKLNIIENHQYYSKNDCIWNDECELKPNNFNFFDYSSRKTTKPKILSCEMNVDKIVNYTITKLKKKVINLKSSCPCRVKNLHTSEVVVKKCISPNFIVEDNFKIPKTSKHSCHSPKLD